MRWVAAWMAIGMAAGWNVGVWAAERVERRPGRVVLEADLVERIEATIDKGIEFLLASQQEDGGWTLEGRTDPAVTSLIAKCLLQHPRYGWEHPATKRAVAFVLRYRQPDGGIYIPGLPLRNYYTSVALMMLSQVPDGSIEPVRRQAQAFLKRLQWDEGEGHTTESAWYGGAGYGRHRRPDLSNTQMMLDALHQSGLPPDDPAFQKALKFIERCQMLSEVNDQPFARHSRQGGFIYTCVNGGESKAGTILVEGRQELRCYGSMTYAGFKSLLYAGLTERDPRVKAAIEWFRQHWTLDSNPNMPERQTKEGLYYYYHVFARAMHAWGRDKVEDAQGQVHDWRRELAEKLISLQRADGSWINEADRWMEGNANLVTAYSILALQTVLR